MAPGCMCEGEEEGDDCNCFGQISEVTVVYRDVYRPDTLGNRMGDYVANIVDTSIEKINGLLSKLKN